MVGQHVAKRFKSPRTNEVVAEEMGRIRRHENRQKRSKASKFQRSTGGSSAGRIDKVQVYKH